MKKIPIPVMKKTIKNKNKLIDFKSYIIIIHIILFIRILFKLNI